MELEIKKNNKSVADHSNKTFIEDEATKDMDKCVDRKPKLIKSGRMQTIRPNPTDTNRKAPALY